MAAEQLQWGILGTGMIASKFAGQLRDCSRGEMTAVGSRSQASAERFTRQFGGQPHGSYEALLADPKVTAIYNSLPNSLHHRSTLDALQAGKHVLCEKPLAGNEADGREMFAAADAAGRVLVEAFMYRRHPLVQKMLELVHSDAIGPVKLIRANFTFQRDASRDDGRYQPGLAGGSLMDVGCYCLNLARAVTRREPDEAQVMARRHEFGVDEYAAGLLRFGDTLCTFTCGMTVDSDRTAFIAGDRGHMTMGTPWFGEGPLTIHRDGASETFEAAPSPGLYALEADAFAECVLDGATPWITREDSLGNMRLLDRLRDQIGLTYDGGS